MYWGSSIDTVDGSSSYSSLSREAALEGIGRGAVGGGGGTLNRRPAGNGGGDPGFSSTGLSILFSELRGGNEDIEGDRRGGLGVGVSAGVIDSGGDWTGGTGRSANGGGGGTAKGGGIGTFTGPASTL